MILGKLPLVCMECNKVFLVEQTDRNLTEISCVKCGSLHVGIAHELPKGYERDLVVAKRQHWAVSAIAYRQSQGLDTPELSFMEHENV